MVTAMRQMIIFLDFFWNWHVCCNITSAGYRREESNAKEVILKGCHIVDTALEREQQLQDKENRQVPGLRPGIFDLTVITRNTKHFAGTGVPCHTPWAEGY